MKKILSLVLALIMCLGLFSCMPNLKKYVIEYADEKISVDSEFIQSDEYALILDKLNSFSLNLIKSFSESNKPNTNYAISPVAVYMSLATACEMASGETRDEILASLDMTYDELKDCTKYIYALCNKEYKYTDSYGTEHISAHEELANSVWLSSDYTYKYENVYSLSTNYNCDVFSISFANGTAKKLINQYIEYKTHSVIKNDVEISKSEGLSIISVYHLKEIWNEFGRNLTQTLDGYDFTNEDGSTVYKQLLKGTYTGGVAYVTSTFTSFAIETEHGYKLYFMIPRGRHTLDDVFTDKNISRMINRSNSGFIDNTNQVLNYTRVLFPAFSVGFSGDVSENLINDFNISSLFDKETCNLSNIVFEDAWCEKLIHTAQVNVNARGIEGESIDLAQSDKIPPELPNYEKVYHDLTIDKAFDFVLVDESGMILYAGEINHFR